MLRKCLLSCLGVGLAGLVLATEPQVVQFFPVPPANCFSKPQIQPVVSQVAMPKPTSVQDLAKPALQAKAKPPVVEIYSSGPLPPFPALPTAPEPGRPDGPLPLPYETPESSEPAPLSVPKNHYPETKDKSPQDDIAPPEIIDPLFKPVNAQDSLIVPPGRPEVTPVPGLVPPAEKLPETPAAPPKPASPQPEPFEFTPPVGKTSSPWVIRVEVVKERTQLVASSKNAEFHIRCQNLKVQSPTGDIQAEGQIKVTAAGLDMDCEKLTISWQDDWVMMEGKVHLRTQKDSQQVELLGDSLKLKLTTLTSTSSLKAVTPQMYKATYAPQVHESKTPAPQAAAAPASSSPPVTPFYQRVTKDD